MCVFFSLPLMCCKSSQLWCFYFHTLMQFHNLCPMNLDVFIYLKIEKRAFWESSVWQIVIKWACFWFYLFWGKGEGLDNRCKPSNAFVLFFFFISLSTKNDEIFFFIYLYPYAYHSPFQKSKNEVHWIFPNFFTLKLSMTQLYKWNFCRYWHSFSTIKHTCNQIILP